VVGGKLPLHASAASVFWLELAAPFAFGFAFGFGFAEGWAELG
jgi:hypothetical protein